MKSDESQTTHQYLTDTICFFLIDLSRQCSLIYGGNIAKHLLLPCENLSYHSLLLVAAMSQLANSCLVILVMFQGMPSSVDVIADSDSDVAEVVDIVDSNFGAERL